MCGGGPGEQLQELALEVARQKEWEVQEDDEEEEGGVLPPPGPFARPLYFEQLRRSTWQRLELPPKASVLGLADHLVEDFCRCLDHPPGLE